MLPHVKFWRDRLETLGLEGTVGETIGGELRILQSACQKVLKREVDKWDAVLDIGCGLGFLLPLMPPCRYTGIDLLPELIEECKRLHADQEFYTQDLLNLDAYKAIPNNQYNVVVGHSVLFSLQQYATQEHLEKVIRELCRIGNKVVFFSCYGGKIESDVYTVENGALFQGRVR